MAVKLFGHAKILKSSLNIWVEMAIDIFQFIIILIQSFKIYHQTCDTIFFISDYLFALLLNRNFIYAKFRITRWNFWFTNL